MNNVIDMRAFRVKRLQKRLEHALPRYKKGLVSSDAAGKLLMELQEAEKGFSTQELMDFRQEES